MDQHFYYAITELDTYLAGYHEASTACPLVNAWEEEVRRRFGKRPEAHGLDPYHEALTDDNLKLSIVAFQ